MGTELPFGEMRACEVHGGDGSIMQMSLIPLNCALRMATMVSFMLCVLYNKKPHLKSMTLLEK